VPGEDRLIQPDAQRRWAHARTTEVIEVAFDHGAQMSHPKEVTEILTRSMDEISSPATSVSHRAKVRRTLRLRHTSEQSSGNPASSSYAVVPQASQ
jgi:hypothetical protein